MNDLQCQHESLTYFMRVREEETNMKTFTPIEMKSNERNFSNMKLVEWLMMIVNCLIVAR
jgi:hypothetical protein